ncbi:MAG TPA: ABC transporter ATP-binding protein [Oligoflexia bacterium]|nr:ABC transporter ATP-binding protein [Oligoflexia bacterium]HMP49051.1 ABC transporter ATP-binding protein [Oligoflexia bacterium]
MSIIVFEEVTKSFPPPSSTNKDKSGENDKVERICALPVISFNLDQNETLALTGPSGSGKSTLLNLAAGLERPTSGRIILFDRLLQDMTEDEITKLRGTSIGFIFQSFRLLGSLTSLENIELPAKLNGVNETRKKSIDLLERVGLGHRKDHYPEQLSGGEQQRVAVARAFSGSPKLILADEPTGNLDSKTASTIIDLIFSMVEENKISLLVATHDNNLASRASRLLSLNP